MNDSTTSPIPGRRRKSSGLRRAIIFGAVVVAAGATWYGVHTYRAKAAAGGEYMFGTVDTGNIEDLVASSGSLQPRDFVDVGAQVSGQIEKIYVEIGDVVQVGQLLTSIDATTSQAKVDANEASIQSAKANLKSAENALDKAKRDAERQKRLYEEGATTYETMINQQTQYEEQQSRVEQSKSALKQQEANARIEANNLRFTKIVAPIAGTVMSIAVKQGQTVNATQNVPIVMKIANLDTMTIQSDVSEADVSKLDAENNPVYFTTLGGGTRRWYSKLKRIEPTPKVQNSVVLYNALFDIQNEDRFLMPSMSAQVYFVAAEARNVVRVPMAALQQGQQIARELAAKERAEGKTPAAATPGAAPGAARAPGAPGAPGNAAANAAPAAAAAAGGSVPATPAAQAPGGAPANRQANAQGNRAANGQGGPGGQRQGGGNGQRQGGGFGGFNPQNMTPEQIAEFQRMRAQRGGGGGGGGGGGNFNRQNMAGNNAGAAAATRASRAAQRRNGTVMVKTADGKVEPRRVVVGVTDRVLGEVLEGLKDGDEVVIARRETEAAAAPRGNNQNQNQNQNQGRQGGNFQQGNFQQGGFPGGGRGF